MYARTPLPDLHGTFYCSTCHIELEREDKLVGLNEGSAYDIYCCPQCFLAHWVLRPLNNVKLAS
jgi:hypothetical protein